METTPLQLLRRHGRNCEASHSIDHYTSEIEERRKGAKHCTCGIVAGGTLKGIYRKKSTKQTDWKLARMVADSFAAAGDWDGPPSSVALPVETPPPSAALTRTDRPPMPLSEAIKLYLTDHQNSDSAKATVKKYRLVLAEMQRFADQAGLLYLEDWTPIWVRQLRDGWKVSPLTRSKKLSAVKPFFEFFVEDGRLTRNPARIKSRRNRALRVGDEDSTAGQKNPFSDAELTRMIEACSQLGKNEFRQWPQSGHKGLRLVAITELKNYHRKITGQDLADFIHISIHTGLRISDVCTFDISRLTPRGEVKLRATKNGAWILVPLPEWLQERIRARARTYGPRIFRPTGTGIDAITNNWRRPLNALWENCGPWEQNPTPHRFRHTFVRLLLDRMLVDSKVTLAMIATLAGDTEEMIRKHYSAWMPDQQRSISEILAASFAKIPRLG